MFRILVVILAICPFITNGQTLLNPETSVKAGANGSVLVSNGTSTAKWRNLDTFSRYLPIGSLPDFIPSDAGIRAATVLNRMTGVAYSFTNGKWYAQGVILSTTAPPLEVNTDIVNSVVVNHTQVFWRNPATGKIYYCDGSAWIELAASISPQIASLQQVGLVDTAQQELAGKKIFRDSIIAESGIKTNGLTSNGLINAQKGITSKGLNSEGGATKAAIEFNGVKKGKRRLITAHTTLEGTDFYLEVQCATADIVITLPPLTPDTDGWIFDIARTDNTTFKAKFLRPDGTYINILSKRSATLRNNSINWYFD